MGTPSYVIITPARNEEPNLQRTIDSVVAQTVQPRKWVLVNDGSTDRTGQIVDTAAAQHSWITAVHRRDRGFRNPGGGVIESFYEGYARVGEGHWDYLLKLDGDLSFDSSHFASCFARFDEDPKLGLGGGTICNEVKGVLVSEAKGDPSFHVRGATKIYRRECWFAIGGLLKAPGWDTLDELKANMLGWKTYSFPELKLQHHRLAGEADGAWKNWVKNGRANYITGYHPLFMVLKCAQRFFKRPYGIAGLGLLMGFLSGFIKRVPQVDDRELIKYLRQEQMNRLLLRKSLWDVQAPANRLCSNEQVAVTQASKEKLVV